MTRFILEAVWKVLGTDHGYTVKDTVRPLPTSLVPEMGSNIENKTEFGERAYGKEVMFYPGELDTVPFSVTQLPCDDN